MDSMQNVSKGVNTKKGEGRKWFKRSGGDGKMNKIDGKKQRSASIFARLCGYQKKKNRQEAETDSESYEKHVTGGDTTGPVVVVEVAAADENAIEILPHRRQEAEDYEISNKESDSFIKYDSSADRSSSVESSAAKDNGDYPDRPPTSDQQPTVVQVEFSEYMGKISQDWIDFGKSLGIDDQEIKKIVETSNEENDREIQRMVNEAPSLVLGSIRSDSTTTSNKDELPPILPLSASLDMCECDSLALMSDWDRARGDDRRQQQNSMASNHSGADMISSSIESESKSMTTTTASSSSECESTSSFYSMTVSSSMASATVSTFKQSMLNETKFFGSAEDEIVIESKLLPDYVEESVSLQSMKEGNSVEEMVDTATAKESIAWKEDFKLIKME